MAGFDIHDRTTRLLSKVLDMRQLNQEIIASNIANADTPGYAPARLRFEDQLRSAVESGGLRATSPGHLPLAAGAIDEVRGEVVVQRDVSGVGDRNNVSLDTEMTLLAENQLLYESAVQMLNKKLGVLRYVARESR